MQADYIIRFKVSEADFEKTVYKWLSEGDYTPDDILENIITENNAIYIPMYYFWKAYQGSCSASVGYPRWVDYYEWNYAAKRNERKQRMEIDWHPHSQPISGETVVKCYAGNNDFGALAKHAAESAINTHDLESPGKYPTDGFRFVSFYNDPQHLWETTGSKEAYNQAWQKAYASIPGQYKDNVNINVQITKEDTFSYYAPYWLFFYEYEGEKYYVYMDGYHPERVGGTKPEDAKRKSHVSGLKQKYWLYGLAFSVLAVFIKTKMYNETFELSWPNFFIFLVCFLIAGGIAEATGNSVKSRSVKVRQEKLALKLNRQIENK